MTDRTLAAQLSLEHCFAVFRRARLCGYLLCDLLGVSKQAVYLWKKKHNTPSGSNMVKLALLANRTEELLAEGVLPFERTSVAQRRKLLLVLFNLPSLFDTVNKH